MPELPSWLRKIRPLTNEIASGLLVEAPGIAEDRHIYSY
jgi:hypothetical protein